MKTWSNHSSTMGYSNTYTRLSSRPWAIQTTLASLWAFPWLGMCSEAAHTSRLYSLAVHGLASFITAVTRSTKATWRGGWAQTWLTFKPTTWKTQITVCGLRRQMSTASPRWWGWWQWWGEGERRKVKGLMTAMEAWWQEAQSLHRKPETGVTARYPTWLWCIRGAVETWGHSWRGRPSISAKSEATPTSLWTSARHRQRPSPCARNLASFKLRLTVAHMLIAGSQNWPE